MSYLKLCILGVFFCLFNSSLAQSQSVCILDLTAKNAEATEGNKFSLEHILKSAGFSYFLTDSVNLAIKYPLVLSTSNIETTTFSQVERDSISSFISKGGVFIATNVKDPLLFNPFGIASTSFNSSRFFIRFHTSADSNIFKLFDDPYEKEIRLGDTADYATTIGTRAFTLISGDTLASYETGEVAMALNHYMLGHTYLLGTQYKEVILRPQVKKDYNATRAYSNSFEPGQDVYVFLLAGILKKHLPHAIWKHTAPCNYKAALVITHDVDATTSMERFDDYANYEKLNNIKSTYLVTTHYVHDRLAKNFYDGYENDILKVYEMGHDIQSHSVSHVPDFDDESFVQMGSPGNNRYNYAPYFDGQESSNVTVFGEAEVSRELLQGIISKEITCFRPGYLAFHDQLINVLDSLHFPFSSSHSANNVMTHFPFFSHTDLSMSGRLTSVLEIPNTISDVFTGDPINEGNYLDKVSLWEQGFTKAYANNTSTVLLIHPTRYYKLYAEQLLLNYLPNNAIVSNISEYGNYWLNRDVINYSSKTKGDSMLVWLSKPQSEINDFFSLIVQNGRDFMKILVFDADSVLIPFVQSNWELNDVIIHNPCERPAYTNYSIKDKPESNHVQINPNPSYGNNAFLHFELMEETLVDIEIYDLSGQTIYKLADKQKLNLGIYNLPLNILEVSRSVYFIRIIIGQETYYLKWVVAGTD